MRVWTIQSRLGPDATGTLPQATVPAGSAAVLTNLRPERFQSPSLLLLQFLAKSAGVRLWEYTLHLRISGSRQKRRLLPLLVHLWQYTLQRIPGSRQKRQLSPLLVPLLPLLRRSLTQDSSSELSSGPVGHGPCESHARVASSESPTIATCDVNVERSLLAARLSGRTYAWATHDCS